MPFDGIFVRPGSPSLLPEAARKLTAERRAAVAQARASIAVLDALLELFADGKHWMQGDFYNGAGSYCLVGGLQRVRRLRKAQDKAARYLIRAIRRVTWERTARLIDFNDDLDTKYADIRCVIGLARKLAQQMAEGVV
jgi:hypothetical protein